MTVRHVRRLTLESLEERRLLSMATQPLPQTVFYDYVEDGVLKGGQIEIDPADPLLAAVDTAEAAAAWNVATVVDNGPIDNRIDLVLVGDGYTTADMESYRTHVDRLLPEFFGETPLDVYSTYFNVHRVDVISNESGVDNDPTEGILRDTALDMRFWCGGTERLLCINVSKARAAANQAPDRDQILALANTTKYGGAGYTSSDLGTLSGANGAAVELALHEFGHSFADLADEYTYGKGPDYTGSEPSRPNASIHDEAALAAQARKWYRWLDEPNVGAFEGAMQYERGVYRPTNNSKMRSLGKPFEQINVEQFVMKIYETVEPIDDATEPGTYDQTTTFFVDPVDPTTHPLDIQWFVDGKPIPGAVMTTLDPSTLGLAPGNHEIEVVVVDNTELVRDESFRAERMTETRNWTLIQSVGGGPLIVSTTDDVHNGDYSEGDLSLREALWLAGLNPGHDVIRFDVALNDAVIAVDPALQPLDIDSDVDIEGTGGQTLTVQDGGTLLAVAAGVTAILSDLAVSDCDFGTDREFEGSIHNEGTLTLRRCSISDNRVYGSTIVNNGQMTLADCAIVGNRVAYGGGPYNTGTMTIANTTISGNASGWYGAGLMNFNGTLTVINSTIVENAGIDGGPGGIYTHGGATTFYNTIVSRNMPYDMDEAPGGSNNLIGGDPKLGPLADNGGPTRTHALSAGSPAIDAGSNHWAADAGLDTDQRGTDRVVDGDADGTATVDIGAVEFAPLSVIADVVDRRIFYNNSAFDKNDAAAGGTDDGAVAPDKEALQPDATATWANYTNYARGINGIMVDIAGLAHATDLNAADDFTFRVGNDNEPGGWSIAPAPNTLAVRQGAGLDGADRVAITWPDNAIQNQWLQVIVRATDNTGLTEPDVFYFGNAVAEAGDRPNNAIVNATDEIVARNFQHSAADPARIDDPYDYDRDGLVNGTDQILARNHRTNPLTMLRLMTAPAAEPESLGPIVSQAELDWLYEFERMIAKNSQSRGKAVVQAVDMLIAGDWQ